MTGNAAHKPGVAIMDLAPDLVIAKMLAGIDWVEVATLDTRLLFVNIPEFGRRNLPLPCSRRVEIRQSQPKRPKDLFRGELVQSFFGNSLDQLGEDDKVKIT